MWHWHHRRLGVNDHSYKNDDHESDAPRSYDIAVATIACEAVFSAHLYTESEFQHLVNANLPHNGLPEACDVGR